MKLRLLAAVLFLVGGCGSATTSAPDGTAGADGPGTDGAVVGPDVPPSADVVDDPSGADTTGDVAAEEASPDAPADTSAGDVGPATPMALTCATCAPGLKLCRSLCRDSAGMGFDCATCRAPSPETGCGGPTCDPCAYAVHATATCTAAGACAIAACDPGWADCDGNVANGCEADLHAATTCGACGTACAAGQVCTPGGCQAACSPPMTACPMGGPCADLTSDAQNCGGCFLPCGPGQVCQAGKCVAAPCAGGTVCNGACVDLATSATNCGKCGNSCQGPYTAAGAVDECVAGSCVRRCSPGFSLCGTDCVALSGDTEHCGSCRHACAATEVCVAGGCTGDASLRLATGLTDPLDLAVDDSSVYWTDVTAGTINRVGKGGGAVTPIARDQATPARIAVDDSHVYWSNFLGGAVMRAPKGGGAATVVSSAVQPIDVVLAGDSAYWIETPGSAPGADTHPFELHKAPKSGGTSVLLAKCIFGYDAAAPLYSPSAVYLVKDGDGLYLGCPPDLVAATGGLRVIRFDTAHGDAMTEMTTAGAIYRLPGVAASGPYFYHLFGGISVKLGWFDRTNGTAVGTLRETSMVPYHFSLPGPMVASACGLYWFGRAGRNSLTDLVSFQPNASAVAIDRHADQPRRIAVDGTHLYWTEKQAIGRTLLP